MLKLPQVHERMVTLVRAFKEGLVGYSASTGAGREVDIHPWAVFCRHERECFSAMMQDGGDGRDQTLGLVNFGITVCEPAIVSFVVEAYHVRRALTDESLSEEELHDRYPRGELQRLFRAGDPAVVECLLVHTCTRLKRTQSVLSYQYNPKTWALEWLDLDTLEGADAKGAMIDYIQAVWERNDKASNPMRQAVASADLFGLTQEQARAQAFEIGCRDYLDAMSIHGTYEDVLGLQPVERMAVWRKARGSG